MDDTKPTTDKKECFQERINKDTTFLTSHIIKDQNHFSKDFAKLFMSEEFKDVTLVSNEGVKIPAHRIILATRCAYYNSLLFGQMKEAKDEEVKTNCSTEVLKQLLKFIYVGRLNLLRCSTLEIMELLDKARMMFMDDLYRQVHQFLCDNLTSEKYRTYTDHEKDKENREKIQDYFSASRVSYSPFVTDEQFIKHALQILNESIKNNFPEMMNLSISFIKENISVVLESNYFEGLTPMAINELLRLDALDGSQVKIFKAIVDWMSAKNDELDDHTREGLLKNIHLYKMSYEDLCQVVRPTGLFSDTVLMDAINARLIKGEKEDFKQIGRQKAKQMPRWITEMNFRFGKPQLDDDDDLLIADEVEIGEEVLELTENQFNGYDEGSDKDVKFDINDATLHICLTIEGSCDICEERDKVDDTSDSDSDANDEEDMDEGTGDHLEKVNIIDTLSEEKKPTLIEWQNDNIEVLEREIPQLQKYLKQREAHFLNNDKMDLERNSDTPISIKKRKKSSRLTKQSKFGKITNKL